MKLAAVLTAALLAGSATAQPARNWNRGTAVAITVNNQRFIPSTIRLRRGQPYVLTIRNRSDRRHNFAAKEFFALARVAPQDSGWVTDNKVDLRPGQTARLRIVAPDVRNAAFTFRSTNLLDAAAKMKGTITVR